MNFLERIPPVTRALIVINVIIFVFGALVPRADMALQNFCGLHFWSSPLFNPAQVFTYMFLHGSITHLLFNMLTLYFFGSLIEPVLTSRRYLFYYIMCGIGAALIQEVIFAIEISYKAQAMGLSPEDMNYLIRQGANAIRHGQNFVDPMLGSFNALYNGVTVGASGAIYGVLLAAAMMFPNLPMYIMFLPVPIKAKWAVTGFAVIELLLGIANNIGDNTAHFAHLGGMLIGVVIILIWRKKGVIRARYY